MIYLILLNIIGNKNNPHQLHLKWNCLFLLVFRDS